MSEHRFEQMDWFDISLDDIENADDFEMAMELAHVAGFEDGQLEADEHNYADAVLDERERIIAILNDPIYADLIRAHLIGVINGASLDSEWD